MGHEIGLHNDLISLWIGTGILPEDHLADILTTLRKNGLHIIGSVGHGSRLCYKFGYLNHEIFAQTPHDNTLKELEIQGKKLPLYQLKMMDFGLEYDASFTPWKYSITDSGNNMRFSNRTTGTTIPLRPQMLRENFVPAILANGAKEKNEAPIIQCLFHADHWSFLYAMGQGNIPKCQDHMTEKFLNQKRATKLFVVKNFPNVLYAHTLDLVTSYNDSYNRNIQHFKAQETYVPYPVSYMKDKMKTPHILEFGCGQGDFLHLVSKALPQTEGGMTVGVDASFAAIADCAVKYPDKLWIVDTGEGFLDKLLSDMEETRHIPKKYGLILDKTGLTSIPDFDTAYAVLKKISYCLAPGGRYIYLASAGFYARRYADTQKWPYTWITIARKIFKTEDILLNQPFHIIAFGMGGG